MKKKQLTALRCISCNIYISHAGSIRCGSVKSGAHLGSEVMQRFYVVLKFLPQEMWDFVQQRAGLSGYRICHRGTTVGRSDCYQRRNAFDQVSSLRNCVACIQSAHAMSQDMHLVAGRGLLQYFFGQLGAALLNGAGRVHLRLQDHMPLFAQMVGYTIEVMNCWKQ